MLLEAPLAEVLVRIPGIVGNIPIHLQDGRRVDFLQLIDVNSCHNVLLSLLAIVYKTQRNVVGGASVSLIKLWRAQL